MTVSGQTGVAEQWMSPRYVLKVEMIRLDNELDHSSIKDLRLAALPCQYSDKLLRSICRKMLGSQASKTPDTSK